VLCPDQTRPVVSLLIEAKSSVTPERRGQNPHLTPQEPIFSRKSVKSSIFTLFGAKFSRSHPAAVAPICPMSCRSGVLRHGGMAADTTGPDRVCAHTACRCCATPAHTRVAPTLPNHRLFSPLSSLSLSLLPHSAHQIARATLTPHSTLAPS
jgi:hypothetical protein